MTPEIPCYRTARHQPHLWLAQRQTRRCPGIADVRPGTVRGTDTTDAVRQTLAELRTYADDRCGGERAAGVLHAVAAVESAIVDPLPNCPVCRRTAGGPA
jgi:hypothetical protein